VTQEGAAVVVEQRFHAVEFGDIAGEEGARERFWVRAIHTQAGTEAVQAFSRQAG